MYVARGCDAPKERSGIVSPTTFEEKQSNAGGAEADVARSSHPSAGASHNSPTACPEHLPKCRSTIEEVAVGAQRDKGNKSDADRQVPTINIEVGR